MNNIIYQHRSKPFLLTLTVVAVMMGTLLRVVDLDRQVVWHDEAHTVLRSMGYTTQEFTTAVFDGQVHRLWEIQRYQQFSPGKGIAETLRALTSHPEHSPLYYLLVRWFAPFFHSQIAGARLLAAVSGLVLLPCVYLLGRRLFPQQRSAALIAMLLVAVSPIQILYAREARQYALFEVWVVLATGQLLKACRDRKGWWEYACCLGLGLYTHLIFGLLFFAHVGFVLFSQYRRSCWRPFLASAVAAGISFAPWVGVIVTKADDLQRHTAWVHTPLSFHILLLEWGRHFHHILLDFPGDDIVLALTVPIILGGFLFALLKSGRDTGLLLGMTVALNSLPFMIPDLLTGGRRSMEARYFLPALLAIEIGLAFALSHLRKRLPHGAKIVSILLVGLLGTTAIFGSYYLGADTWWNKNSSRSNPTIAQIINRSSEPLIVSDLTTISPGEILSMSYLLDAKVKLLLFPRDVTSIPELPIGEDLFLFKASPNLSERLGRRYTLLPIGKENDTFYMRVTP